MNREQIQKVVWTVYDRQRQHEKGRELSLQPSATQLEEALLQVARERDNLLSLSTDFLPYAEDWVNQMRSALKIER